VSVRWRSSVLTTALRSRRNDSVEATDSGFGSYSGGTNSPDPFLDAFPFELAQGGQHVHLQSWHRCLRSGMQTRPEGVEVLEQRDDVTQISPKAIESPADQHIEASPPGVANYVIERWPALHRT
jgi:hypothetical protein